MFNSVVLEVGIGLALLFFFMSLIATAACEAIENLVKVRAKFLEQGISELLDGTSNKDLVERFYKHPLVSSLYAGPYVSGSRNLPSYIPRQSFSLAVLDLVASDSGNAPLSVASLRKSLDSIKTPNPIQRVLLTTIDSAGEDIGKVRQTFEDWFDGTMDRVAGWYKRRASYRLAAVGLGAAVILNVDSITIAQHLFTDKPLRDAVVAMAEEQTETPEGDQRPQPTLAQLSDKLTSIGYPIGWTIDGGLYPTAQTCQALALEPSRTGQSTTQPAVTPPQAAPDAGEAGATLRCEYTMAALKVFPGWLATMLAIMLGAPFWFDLLNRMMVIRSTVKPREKSPDETGSTAGRQAASGPTSSSPPAGPASARPQDADEEAQAGNAAAFLAANSGSFVPHVWKDGTETGAL